MHSTPPKPLGTLEALQEEARAFVCTLTPNGNHATLITLSGELGAGKTSFTQGLAKALGSTELITSPTFVLQKIYTLPENKTPFKILVHVDAYRLEGEHSLYPLEFIELYKNPETLMVLEWPEIVINQLPTPEVAITLAILPNNTRSVSYTYAQK